MYIPEFACGLILGLIFGAGLIISWAIYCGKKNEKGENDV